MAERRPDLAREHRLHDRFRGPPRASPVRFQVSRPADRTSRGWARGVPLAECRFPGPATRRLGRLRRESERSTAPGICAPLRENLWWCVVVVVVAATPNYLRQASQNLRCVNTFGIFSEPQAHGGRHVALEPLCCGEDKHSTPVLSGALLPYPSTTAPAHPPYPSLRIDPAQPHLNSRPQP